MESKEDKRKMPKIAKVFYGKWGMCSIALMTSNFASIEIPASVVFTTTACKFEPYF